jgi:hypothetical protein
MKQNFLTQKQFSLFIVYLTVLSERQNILCIVVWLDESQIMNWKDVVEIVTA